MARCGALTQDGTKCRNRAGTSGWCHLHRGGRSTYKPRSKASRRQSPPPASRPKPRPMQTWDGAAASKAAPPRPSSRPVKARPGPVTPPSSTRVTAAARRASKIVTQGWTDQVLDHLADIVGSPISASLSASDCAELAKIAALLLDGRPPRRGSFKRFVFGAFPHEPLADAVLDHLGLPENSGRTATGRALQSVGIALCRQEKIQLSDCPCFQAPAQDESEAVVFLLLRLATGDWTGLADVPLALIPPS